MALGHSKTLDAILEILPDNPNVFGEKHRNEISELLKLENHDIEIEKVRFTDYNHYRMYK